MLIALINNRDTKNKAEGIGDVMVVKLPGATWGHQEVKDFILVEWEDEEIENSLKALEDPEAFIVYPYKEYEEVNIRGEKKREVRIKSYERVDINSLESNILQKFNNKKDNVGLIKTSEFSRKTVDSVFAEKNGTIIRRKKTINSSKIEAINGGKLDVVKKGKGK